LRRILQNANTDCHSAIQLPPTTMTTPVNPALLRQIGATVMAIFMCLMATTASAATLELSGVTFPDSVTVAGKTLVRNGAGIRYKAIFKVYTAGLYLESRADTTEGVLNLAGPKRMAITMLRDIDSKELGKLFARGIEDNMEKGSFAKLIPGVIRMSKVFSDHKVLKEGDTFELNWVPGTGTVLTVKGVDEKEPFKEPEFFDALLRIWLGPSPADWKLKEALLGKAK
jgi:hypothetical protein